MCIVVYHLLWDSSSFTELNLDMKYDNGVSDVSISHTERN